jgi:transcriptional regulator with XRE-family HTH domain
MTDTTFFADDLISLRRDLGLTQQEMAARLDMALRSYQAIETGESAYRYIHRLAVERAALAIAADNKAPMLAPASVRRDAIELVRVGQATGKPEFLGSKTDALGRQAESATTERFRAAYSVVGELVLLTTALDHQLNHVLIQILHLTDSPLLEAVVATLDMNRKVEMLKARAKHISNPAWQKALQTHLDKLEQISSWRNIACHTVLIPDEEHGAVFAPAAAAQLLKNLQLGENSTSKKIPITEFVPRIQFGESALFEGQVLIQNFERMNTERLKRFPNNAVSKNYGGKPTPMVITVYGDESGTHDASPFMLLSGFVASEEQWQAFDARWGDALKQVGLSHFHATDHWGTNVGEQFGPEIVKLTGDHIKLGYVIRINKDDYKNHYIAGIRPRKPQLDTMYGVAFRFLVAFLITRLPVLLGRSDLTFNIILESGAAGSKDAERIRAALKEQLPAETAMLGSVTFGDKKTFPGLQASDALAFGAYQIEPTGPQLSDVPEGATISQMEQSSQVKPPIFRCALDAETLRLLKDDILALVDIRKRYAESLKG